MLCVCGCGRETGGRKYFECWCRYGERVAERLCNCGCGRKVKGQGRRYYESSCRPKPGQALPKAACAMPKARIRHQKPGCSPELAQKILDLILTKLMGEGGFELWRNSRADNQADTTATGPRNGTML